MFCFSSLCICLTGSTSSLPKCVARLLHILVLGKRWRGVNFAFIFTLCITTDISWLCTRWKVASDLNLGGGNDGLTTDTTLEGKGMGGSGNSGYDIVMDGMGMQDGNRKGLKWLDMDGGWGT